MTSNRSLGVTHDSHVGHVRRHVIEVARGLGASAERAGEWAIVATELATNTVKHGGGGEILVREMKEADPPGLEIHALDKGPGMTSPHACMRDGYSTAGSAGTGLGAVQRLAGNLDIFSQPGGGTVVWALLSVARPLTNPGRFEVGGVSVAMAGEECCGDSWDVQSVRNGMRAIVADGLGHGPFAEEASREAVTVFRRHARAGPVEALDRIHHALLKTRGAAASVVEIVPGQKSILSAGVGNVATRLTDSVSAKSYSGDNGTLGVGVRRMRAYPLPWNEEFLLILHTDGISSQWNPEEYPGLIRRHPALIAGLLYRDFRRQHDDATVVVIRQRAL